MDKKIKNKRKEALSVFNFNIFNKTTVLALLSGVSVAFIDKVLDWWEEGVK